MPNAFLLAAPALTMHSRAWFLETQGGALVRRHPALFVATKEMRAELAALGDDMARFTDSLEEADEARMLELFPPLRLGGEAIVAGQGDYFEVWNPADWNLQMDQLQDIETNNQRFATLDLSRGYS